jgi:hypothetical protein
MPFVFLAEEGRYPQQQFFLKNRSESKMTTKTAPLIAICLGLTTLLSTLTLPSQKALAQSEITFGPETFVRGSGEGKPKYTRSFAVTNTLIPYTLTASNGETNGSQFVKKAVITLNGQELTTLTKASKTLVLAVRLQAQNNLQVVLK